MGIGLGKIKAARPEHKPPAWPSADLGSIHFGDGDSISGVNRINQRTFIKRTGQGLAALAVGPAALAKPKTEPVATFSIAGVDPHTGDLGVAVQSEFFAVGSVVPWAKAGVGAVATQSIAEPSYGPKGLALMEQGIPAAEALQSLLAKDPGENARQVAMVDARGNVGVHTGSRCISYASHRTGKSYSVQANIMAKPTVPAAMVQAFESTTGDLAERMLAALDAAEAEGGDLSGRQSAAMLVVSGEPTGDLWKDRIVDLEGADHKDPLGELRR